MLFKKKKNKKKTLFIDDESESQFGNDVLDPEN